MRSAPVTFLFIALAVSAVAKEPQEALLRLSAACQNAAFARAQGEWEQKKFSSYIRATDEAMTELVRNQYLVEEHLLFKAPKKMNGAERSHFAQIQMKFAKKYESVYGFYAITEMMGWEFRDQLKSGRFHHSARDETKDFRLRVRLPRMALKEFKEVFADYIVKSINHRGEQDGVDQPATAQGAEQEGKSKPQPEAEGRSQ